MSGTRGRRGSTVGLFVAGRMDRGRQADVTDDRLELFHADMIRAKPARARVRYCIDAAG